MLHNTILARRPLSEQATRLDSIAAGIKRDPAAWLVEQPPLSDADRAAHAAASHVRRPAVTS